MVATIHVNQRIRLPNKVKANRNLQSVAKCVCTILAICWATPEEKQIYTCPKWNDKCISQQRIFQKVSPVVMNYKMRHNKNQPARDSLVWPDHFFIINICGGRKTEKQSLDMRGYMQGQPWRKACLMCELARALVNSSRSMKIATFSTWDLQEQWCKCYVASYRANEELMISRMFSRELR